MSVTDHAPVSPEFAAAFRARANAAGAMSYADFVALALYDAQVGYYRRDRVRVGYGPGTDFYTASTSGPVFGELVATACRSLLRPGEPKDFTFVELGAEPGAGVLEGVAHPFAATRTIRLGEPIDLSGRCVVFSNELFDAQPFRRFAFRRGGWRELGVAWREGTLAEIELPDLAPLPAELPRATAEDYVIDAPFAATTLAETIAAQPWTGLFVACDYGRTWRELAEMTPIGTARAYFRHRQESDLLARPGEQDLTCHVCWDWLTEALQRGGFAAPVVESQEAFFIRHAGEAIAALSAAEAGRFSQRKLSLLQLLHPGNLGQKFQVLHGKR